MDLQGEQQHEDSKVNEAESSSDMGRKDILKEYYLHLLKNFKNFQEFSFDSLVEKRRNSINKLDFFNE